MAHPPHLPGPVLGLESSCDETAAALVWRGQVLSSRVASQVALHQRFGGVVPEVAARNHLLTVLPALELALADAGVTPGQLAGIAVTNRPGLIGALLVGVQTAKVLAYAWGLPLIGVDHIRAHAWAGFLRHPQETQPQPQKFPLAALVVSGGHTSLYRVDGPDQWSLLGRTLDDAAGEAFDKFAKILGLAYPGGPEVDRLAALGNASAVALPRGMFGRSDGAYSFSGLKTAARLQIESLGGAEAIGEAQRADLCAAFQGALVEQTVRVTLESLRRHGLRDLLLCGGVAANQGLRKAFAVACGRARVRFWPVPVRWCGDNAAMVAALGEALLQNGHRDDPRLLDAQATGEVRRAAAAASAASAASSSAASASRSLASPSSELASPPASRPQRQP